MNIYELYEKGKFDELGNQHVLCEVIEFDDGQVVAKWTGAVRSLVIHKNIDEFKQISLNSNRELWYNNKY